MAIVVIVMVAMSLGNPIDLATGPMLFAAAAGGLFTELIILGLLWKQSQHDLNVKGALWHIIPTFVGSLLIITALVIRFTGFLLIDPLLGMTFGFALIWASWGILRDASYLLMEGTPERIDLVQVASELSRIEGVSNVQHIHAWALTSGRHEFSAHLRISDKVDQQSILQKAHELVTTTFGFFFATLQLETHCLDETAARDIDIDLSSGKSEASKSDPAASQHSGHPH